MQVNKIRNGKKSVRSHGMNWRKHDKIKWDYWQQEVNLKAKLKV